MLLLLPAIRQQGSASHGLQRFLAFTYQVPDLAQGIDYIDHLPFRTASRAN